MPLPLFDHVDVVVSSIERSLPFYRELLEPLGVTYCHEVGGEQGETIHYLGGSVDGAIGLREKRSDAYPPPYAVFFYDPDGIKLEIVHEPGSPG